MGLFDSLKKKAAPEVETAPEQKEILWVNISRSAMRTDIADGDDGSYFKGCHLWQEGNKIRAFQEGTLLFEVTDKSKAYKELEPLVGKQLERITIRKKTGDYGVYYFVSLK